MRIKEIYLKRYGPIQNLTIKPAPGLQLVFGMNEAGKTLTIDAILKSLISGKLKEFENINRVSENPEGYIVVEQQGKEIKLSEKQTLSSYLEVESEDLRNLFIIRDSDLSIRDQANYFKKVTDRLTGLKTDLIENIQQGLARFGRLTNPSSSARLSNTTEDNKLQDKKNTAMYLVEKIDQYLDQAEQKGLDKIESRVLLKKEKCHNLEQQIDNLKKAQKKELYWKLEGALDQVKKLVEKHKQLSGFSQERFQSINGRESRINSIVKDQQNYKTKISEYKSQAEGIEQILTKTRAKLASLQNKKTAAEAIHQNICFFNRKKQETAEIVKNIPVWKTLAYLFTAAFAAAGTLAGITGAFSIPVLAAPSICFILMVVFLLKLLSAGKIRNRLSAEEESILDEAAAAGFTSGWIKALSVEMSEFINQFAQINNEKQDLESKLKYLYENIDSLQKEWHDKQKECRDLEKQLQEEFRDLGIDDLEAFKQKQQEKNTVEGRLSKYTDILEQEFGKKHPDPENNIPFWEQKLEALKEYGNIRVDIPFNQGQLDALQDEQKLLAKEIEEDNNTLSAHKNALDSFKDQANQLSPFSILGLQEQASIHNLEQLSQAKRTLEKMVYKIDDDFDTAVKAITLFEKVQKEEEAKIADLFEKDHRISQLFSRVTDSRYRKVKFDGTIKVVNANGLELDAEQLSPGGYIPLYLAIRVVLAEDLLGQTRGFFIMDDPFVKSDSIRLEKQFDILKLLQDRGWSILYFSAKEEIKQLMARYTQNPAITLTH
ncbi:MAG: ATP-binding protein [Spirochaetota bacterium]